MELRPYFWSRTILMLFFFGYGGFVVKSQTPDLVRLEYTMMPENKSGIRTNRYRAIINAPIKLGKDRIFVAGLEYNRYEFEFERALPFEYGTLERLHIIDLNLGYVFKVDPEWLMVGIITPRLASNFERGIDNNDFRLNATLLIWKEKKDVDKPYRLILGLSYNSATGLPFPLPLINYNRRFHPNWSYTLGIPRMEFKYHIKEKQVLQTALFLDGYFVNIQDNVVLPDDNLGESISLSALVGGLEYQYKITKEVSVYALMGYSLLQEGLIRDGSRGRAFTLNDQGNIYIRTGFKIGIF